MTMATANQTHHLPGILRLSPEIRHRIYIKVGLGPRSRLEYEEPHSYNLGQQYFGPDLWSWGERRPQKGFFGLLVSCRTIHDEAAAVLYASKRFVVQWDAIHSLAPLRALTPVAISSLTNLKVVLNQSSCHDRALDSDDAADCCSRRNRYDIYCRLDNSDDLERKGGSGDGSTGRCYSIRYDCKHQRPLGGSEPRDLALLAEWQETAAQMAPHISPGKLELSLVCDFDPLDSEVASLAVDAIQSFPPLKDCHVKLSKTPDGRLRQLAEDAVRRGRGIIPPPSAPPSAPDGPRHSSPLAPGFSRLLALPQELRLQILEYTDLITPVKEVMWATSHGRYMASRLFCYSWDGRGYVDECERHQECEFTACSYRAWPKPSIGCFCSRLHAAASSTCKCWAPPTPLFLICRALNEDANRLFFSGNRFVVIDGKATRVLGPPQPSDFRHGSLAASRFLRDVVPLRCLGYLRFLELVFPPYTPGSWPKQDDPVLRDWHDTVDWVRDKINAPALTLRVVAKYHSDQGATDGTWLTSAEAKEIMEAYFRILKPLGRLARDDGLARFGADLTWPWERIESMSWRLYVDDTRAWLTTRERWLKERAERAVLGVRYECQRSRIIEPREGEWVMIFARDC